MCICSTFTVTYHIVSKTSGQRFEVVNFMPWTCYSHILNMRITTFILNVCLWYVHVVTLFICYHLFHYHNINESASTKVYMVESISKRE